MLRPNLNAKGKNFDTVTLMEQSKKAIYNAFGAANLLAGDGTGGSYSQMEGQNSIHMHFVERDISIIEEAWNRDIWKQTFRLNGFKLKWDELPKFRAGDIEEVSWDELGKMWQRLGAAGMAPIRDAKFLNELYETAGISYRFNEDATPEDVDELTSEVTSNAGEGMEEGLNNGTGKVNKGGDSSVGNKENT